MAKLWLMAKEIADLNLEGLPAHLSRMREALEDAGVKKRKRAGAGTRSGYEYLIDALPVETAEEIRRRWTARQLDIVARGQGDADELLALYPEPSKTGTKTAIKAEAAKVIAALYRRNRDMLKEHGSRSRDQFADAWNAGLITAPDWVLKVTPRISARNLQRWIGTDQLDLFNKTSTPVKRKPNSRSTIYNLNDGEVAKSLLALLAVKPKITAEQARRYVRENFEQLMLDGQPTELPAIRTFRRFIKSQREQNRAALQYLTDPDGYKAKTRYSLGRADADIVRLNQLWEIDASPADVMLTDGRYSIYALIDVYSRRLLISVSKTARTDAALALIRTGLERWGVPETIRTDNGSDFISKRFVRAMQDLGIAQDIAPPFSPEKKPFVERAIGTFQRDFCSMLPGFIGHSVADRQRITAATAFSQRLGMGQDKVFDVQLDRDAFAEKAVQWCDHVYAEREHSSLGMSPREKARRWPGAIRKIDNEAVLALLLSPVDRDGIRTITKQGIRVSGATFFALGLEPGQTVFVRHDPDDMGVIYLFSPDGTEYLGRGINVDREGVSRKEMAAAAKAEQKRLIKEELDPLRKSIRKIRPEHMIDAAAPASSPSASIIDMPKRSAGHSTKNITSAEFLVDQNQRRQRAEKQQPDMSAFDRPVERKAADQTPKKKVPSQADYEMASFREFLRIRDMKAQGVTLLPDQENWLIAVQKEPWFKPTKERHEYLEAAAERRAQNGKRAE